MSLLTQVAGNLVTPMAFAKAFAIAAILIVSLIMYFGKDCGKCVFSILKYYIYTAIVAGLIGYATGAVVLNGGPQGLALNMALETAQSNMMAAPQSAPMSLALQQRAPVAMPSNGFGLRAPAARGVATAVATA